MNQKDQQLLLEIQRDEAESYEIYTRLAQKQKIPKNKKILKEIAQDEKWHYKLLKKITGQDIAPRKWKVSRYIFIANTFGLTFGLKLMENSEKNAQSAYSVLWKKHPKLAKIFQDEQEHELKLIDMLKEKKLGYIGSIVLGLNDALVELTGALAGFTFAIQDSKTIGLLGLITGVSASFSMAASEFLSKRQDEWVDTQEAFTSSLYTGFAYVVTVFLLVTPFFLIENHFHALGVTLLTALLIIALFNFYISVAKGYNFKQRFLEMAMISLSVALISFTIGWFVRTYLGIDI